MYNRVLYIAFVIIGNRTSYKKVPEMGVRLG